MLDILKFNLVKDPKETERVTTVAAERSETIKPGMMVAKGSSGGFKKLVKSGTPGDGSSDPVYGCVVNLKNDTDVDTDMFEELLSTEDGEAVLAISPDESLLVLPDDDYTSTIINKFIDVNEDSNGDQWLDSSTADAATDLQFYVEAIRDDLGTFMRDDHTTSVPFIQVRVNKHCFKLPAST